MIGEKTFEIGSADWLTGLASGDNVSDGGFGARTTHVNLTAVPGVLHSPGPVVDESTNVEDEIIASCGDSTYLGKDRFLLGDENNFYWFDTTTTTKKATASSSTYTIGTTDMVDFNGKVYATTTAGASGDITEYDKATTLVEDWWTNASHLNQSALSALTAWRPLLVFNKNLFVGDANKLHRIDESDTVSNGILTLTTEEAISALGIDQGSGRMLIATSAGSNYSGSKDLITRIHVYDGFSNKAIRVVPISGLVTAFRSVGDTTYVFYGNKLGIWTGSGIEYLRTLNFAKGTAGKIIYPHRACSIDNTLYYVDDIGGLGPGDITAVNKQIIAYGEIVNGRKSFYPVLFPDDAVGGLTALFPVRSHELGYAYATDKFFTFDLNSVASVTAGGMSVYSRRYNFARDRTIHGAIMELDGAAPTGNNNLITLSFLDSKGNVNTTPALNPDTRSDVNEWEFTFPTVETRSLQVRINMGSNTTNVIGIRRMTVFYTPKE